MEVHSLNNEAFLEKSLELISKVDFQPDAIVGVLNGGVYLIDAIKKVKGYATIPIEEVKLQRKGERIKGISVVKTLLKVLPYKILDKLRIYESQKAKDKLRKLDLNELSKQKLDFNLSSISKKSIRNILVIDDAIDTGETMFLIKNNLYNLFPDANVKVAVMAWTIETSIVKPDYYLFKNVLVRFPWSKDYKGKDFE